ncbi:MAG: hypothetical protein OXD40_15520, partial [bacterium]|nr:hypothetical protein [bacterium]
MKNLLTSPGLSVVLSLAACAERMEESPVSDRHELQLQSIRSFWDGVELLISRGIPWRFVTRAKGEFHVRQRCCALAVAEERCGP